MAGERAPLPLFAHDFELRVVPLQGVLDDRESQARTASRPRAPGVDPVEPLRNSRNVFGGNTDTGIAYRHVATALVRPPADVDASILGRIAHRILDEIRKRRFELRLRSSYLCLRLEAQVDFAAPRSRGHRILAQESQQPADVD